MYSYQNKSKPNIKYPGDDPTKFSGEDCEWKGKSEPGGNEKIGTNLIQVRVFIQI